MKKMVLGLVAFAAIGAFSQSHDTRFRTFGKFNYGGYDFPYREGGSGPNETADFIPIGALDGSVGPYASGGSAADIGSQWSMLREIPPAALRPDQILDAYGYTVYESTLKNVMGLKYLYKMDALNAQIKMERANVAQYAANFVAKHPNATEIVWEIANEPNAFPSMSPTLYAWYYLTWRSVILQELAADFQSRSIAAASHNPPLPQPTPYPVSKFMPGGLWIFEGMPAPLLKLMSNGIHAYIAGVDFSVGGYSDTYNYYAQFLSALQKPLFCTMNLEPASPTNSALISTECGEYYLGNIASFSYKPVYNFNGQVISMDQYVADSRLLRTLDSYTPVPLTSLIDYGNLHFYPYIADGSSLTLAQQESFLKNLTDLVADHTSSGQVWLTELGNVNPYDDKTASDLVERPVLNYLRTSNIPKIKRWYWYQAEGEDPKFDSFKGFHLDPQTGASLGFALPIAASFLTAGLVDVVPPLSYDDMSSLLHWANVMAARPPIQGLRGLGGGKYRKLGTLYYNLSMAAGNGNLVTPPPIPANLKLVYTDYRELGLSFPPWKSWATLSWDWDLQNDGYASWVGVYYNTASTPSSASNPNLELISNNVCTANPAGSAYRFHCAVDIQDFPFGSPINVQLKADDFINTSLSPIISIAHPTPTAPADLYCPDDLTKPLNLAEPLQAGPGAIATTFNVKQEPLTLTNALVSNSYRYITTAKATSYTLTGGGTSITSDPAKVADLNFTKAAVNIYPDGACVSASEGQEASFTVTSPPAGAANQYIFVNPPPSNGGYFLLNFKLSASPFTPRSIFVGIGAPNTMPTSDVVYIGDYIQAGEVLTSVSWRPTQRWSNTNTNIFPNYFKTLTFSSQNPHAPVLKPFVSTKGTLTVGSESLPVFYAAPGENISIPSNITKTSLTGPLAAKLDDASVSNGFTVSSDGSMINWTPKSTASGNYVVTLTLSLAGGYPSLAAPNAQKFVVVVSQPVITWVPVYKGTFGDNLEFTGDHFQTLNDQTKVSINNVLVTPIKLTNSDVVVTIPANMAVGSLPVKILIGTAASNVVYVDVVPKVLGLNNEQGIPVAKVQAGKIYNLTGAGFGTDLSQVALKINGKTVPALSVSDSQIQFKFPPTSGKSVVFWVIRNNESSNGLPVALVPNMSPIMNMLLN